MPGFRNILVGVDLSKTTTAGIAALDPVADNAIGRALWVAHASGATLTFISVLPDDRHTPEAPWHLAPSTDLDTCAGSAEVPARRAVTNLVRQARAKGVTAGAVVAHGQVWVEIVREVLRGPHDLLVIGTHDPRGLRRLVLGSTAQKMLHECPCPLWISKPALEAAPRNILIASDLAPLSEMVACLGLTFARLAEANAHILDVVEFPLDRLWAMNLTGPLTVSYHSRQRGAAEQGLHDQLERHEHNAAAANVTVHVVDGDGMPDHAISKFIHDHHIDLLVVGTAARHGLSGVLLGNVAERLLPEVPCSILAVKSAGFPCVIAS